MDAGRLGPYFSSNNDREFLAIARYDLANASVTWLVTDDHADLTGWLAPDWIGPAC